MSRALTSVEVLPVDDRPSEPDGFREFVEARSSALLRSGWLLTGDWPSAEDLVQTAPSQSPPPAGETLRVAGGMWGAKLINRHSFSQGSLTGSGDSLYAVEDGYLARIDPVSGATLQTTRYSPPVFSRPVVVGNTVWVPGT